MLSIFVVVVAIVTASVSAAIVESWLGCSAWCSVTLTFVVGSCCEMLVPCCLAGGFWASLCCWCQSTACAYLLLNEIQNN